MRHHLSRKTLCTPIDDDHNISLDDFKNEFLKEKEAPFQCEKCNKRYTSKTTFNYHICRPKNAVVHNTLNRIKQIQKDLDTIAQQLKADYGLELETLSAGGAGASET
ncbi:MAG: hypothetical protein ACO259_09395 [Bacteroidia bacterium]